MSFGPVVNERTAPSAQGAPTDTSVCYVAGLVSAGATDVAVPVASTADFEAEYGPPAGPTVALWDWLDVSFREGLALAYVGGYGATGEYQAGLDLFDSRLGPGQVTVVGETNAAAVYGAVQAHVDANNRIGLLDVNDGDDIAAITTLGDAGIALANSENVGLFGSWATCAGRPGVSGSGGRKVPASAAIAGLCSRVDQAGNPNRAAGGYDFPLQYVDGFELDPNDVDRAACFQHGVNMFADRFGVLENYGFQTPVAQSPNTPFWQLNCSRTRMWLKAKSLAIGERYYMRPIDGQGKLAGRLGSELESMCADLYEVDGLYGATKLDAYNVNTSVSLNTTATAAQAVLKAVVEARLSQYAKSVQIDLVSVPVSGVVSA